jgi:cyclopropane fatty-acyl-phospholipid synthase-like methyltransferase
MSNSIGIEDPYQGYFEARKWDTSTSAEHFWYYDTLMKRVGFGEGQAVLEIGFGDSRFLDWCRNRKLSSVVGLEIQEAAVAKAKALGHEAYMGCLADGIIAAGRKFHIIACFDVLEHLTVSEIRTFFRDSLPYLSDDGRYLLRFPNGNSPFVGLTQCGDPTHRTLISPQLIEEIVKPHGLVVERAFNDRILPVRSVQRLRRRVTYGLRSVIEAVVCAAYFGRMIPLDPNVFLTLRRPSGSS